MWKFLLSRGDGQVATLGLGLVQMGAVVLWSYIWLRLMAKL